MPDYILTLMAMKLLKKLYSLLTPSTNMHSSIFSIDVEAVYVTKVDINGVAAGTELREINNGMFLLGNSMVFTKAEIGNTALFEKVVRFSQEEDNSCGGDACTNCAEAVAAPIDETPAFNAGAVYDSEEFERIQDAVAEQKAIADGQQYFFYHVGEKRWAKATMERTSSDLGRLLAGFALPITTTVKSKVNRLKKLNAAYGLGLTTEEINAAANA